MATAVTITPDAAPQSSAPVSITPDTTPAPRSWTDSAGDFASYLWKQVSPIGGVKGAAQITAHPIDTLKSDADARTQIYNTAESAFKKGNYAEGAAHLLHAAIPLLGPQMDAAGNDFLQGNYAKGLGASVGMGLAMAAPGAIKEAEIIPRAKAAISSAVEAGQNKVMSSAVGRTAAQTISPEMANAPVAVTKGAATTGGPASNITNAEVLQHAADEGIHLTPAQALQTSAAKSQQVLGEESLLTGKRIQEGIAQSKSRLSDAVDSFQDKLDPQRGGLSSEAAGEHLQNSANVARSVMKENVNKAYSDVKTQQANLAGDVRPSLNDLIHSESFEKQPSAAIEQPLTLTGAAKAAITDIQDTLANDPGLQGRQSIQSLRNLRTNFLEKANAYGTNALSDSGQRIYKLAAARVDDAIMDAAKGTPFEQTFRDAGAQNAKLQEVYNSPGSPLYRILNTDDPAKVTDGILNRSSVHEIEALKGENFDLGPLARQAVEDIKTGGFRVTPTGLGGYPDSFLRSLLGPDATKELYLKANIAKRLAENYNPSGSGKSIIGAAQVLHPALAIPATEIARARAMPRPATAYLRDLGKP